MNESEGRALLASRADEMVRDIREQGYSVGRTYNASEGRFKPFLKDRNNQVVYVLAGYDEFEWEDELSGWDIKEVDDQTFLSLFYHHEEYFPSQPVILDICLT